MPVEMLQEFLGKECQIKFLSAWDGSVVGTILAVEDGWIKVEEKKTTHIINADYIKDISIRKEN